LLEWARKPTRGCQATSADAAIRYRTPSGNIEVALIEWKYAEQYRRNPPNGSTSSQPNNDSPSRWDDRRRHPHTWVHPADPERPGTTSENSDGKSDTAGSLAGTEPHAP
jgi:Restriction Endonuclease associating with ARP